MSKADAEAGSVAEEQMLEAPLKLSRWWLYGVFGMIMITPGTVLLVRGLVDRGACADGLDLCLVTCAQTFFDETRVFQSEFRKERACKVECHVTAELCFSRADGAIIAAFVMSLGLICAVSVNYSFEGITKTFTDSLPIGSLKPRPAYHEPVETEEEKRAKGQARRWRFSAEQYVPVTDAWCPDCDIGVEVELRWRTAERGGMEGAVCPRCRKVIVGLL